MSRAALELEVTSLRRQRARWDVARKQRAAEASALDTRSICGKCIGIARRLAGWTGAELAAAVGVTKNSVSMWERGSRRIPRARAVIIARVFLDHDCLPPEFDLGPNTMARSVPSS